MAANVTIMARLDSREVRRTRTMSSTRPTMSSPPMTSNSPPMTAIGIWPARGPTSRTITASHRPAKIPDQRVRAPALVPTPVRDRDPPVGSAEKKPPAMLAAPCARKSAEASVRVPSGFGTVVPIPAACASATSAIATAPVSRCGRALTSGTENGGRDRGIFAMSLTSSTSTPNIALPALTTIRAMSVAYDSNCLMNLKTAQTATVASVTSTAGTLQAPMWAMASTTLAMVLCRVGLYPVASLMTPVMI